jgi:hypothetical protein
MEKHKTSKKVDICVKKSKGNKRKMEEFKRE